MSYRGNAGKSEPVAANYVRMRLGEGRGIYQYNVDFNPRVDNRSERFRLLGKHRTVLGNEKSFDGVKLFLPVKLPEERLTLVSEANGGENIKLTLT